MTLKANNLTLGYKPSGANKDQQAVLTDIELQIERGEVLVIQGPNGSGKSTLMKALARQIKPQKGTVSLDGADIWLLPVQHFARKVAYVPQTLVAPPSMTVLELVALGRSPHQSMFQVTPNHQDREFIEAALKRCSVEKLQNNLVSELSGGEKQRAVIAMALSQGPAYLLLDEPTASLDFKFQLELVDLLAQLRIEGLGIGLILHDLNIAARLADNIALLAAENGLPSQIIAKGPVSEVFAGDTLRRVFAVDIEVLQGLENQVYVPSRLK